MTSLGDAPIAVAEDAVSARSTRDRLLSAGIACFAELGFHAASTRQIETAAGVKRNLIMYHWGSKEAFWKACAERLGTAFAREMALAESQSANVSSPEQLRFFVRAFIRASAKFPQVHRIMVEEGKRDGPRLRWLVEHHVQPMKERVERLLDEATVAGLAPAVDAYSFYYALVGAGSIFAMAPECRLLFGADPSTDAVVSRHADAVASLLLRRPGATHDQ